jgi:hypothetical protein
VQALIEIALMNWCRVALLLIIFPACGMTQSTLRGNACSTLDSTWLDPLNFTENPAAITNVSSIQFGVFAGQYKDIRGLNFLSTGFAMPFRKLVVGIVIHHTGTSGFQQTDLNLLLAKNLGDISIGMIFRSELVSVQSIGGYFTPGVGLGVTKTSGQLIFGASVNGIGLMKHDAFPGQIRRIRVSSQSLFRISDLVSVGLLASKQTDQQISIQPAVYYRTAAINFSVGFDSYGSNVFLLTGWMYKGYECKMLLGYQANLGLINGVELLYKQRR